MLSAILDVGMKNVYGAMGESFNLLVADKSTLGCSTLRLCHVGGRTIRSSYIALRPSGGSPNHTEVSWSKYDLVDCG